MTVLLRSTEETSAPVEAAEIHDALAAIVLLRHSSSARALPAPSAAEPADELYEPGHADCDRKRE